MGRHTVLGWRRTVDTGTMWVPVDRIKRKQTKKEEGKFENLNQSIIKRKRGKGRLTVI